GSGKSTLLAVLARHLDPTDGTYTIDGQDATGADVESVRALFAVVDDEPHVFNGTVRANLALAAPGAEDRKSTRLNSSHVSPASAARASPPTRRSSARWSGKSTLLAVLARHLDPTDGTYTIDGQDATGADVESVRALFAVVDDEPHVFNGTVRANLALAAPGADDAELVDALRRAGLGTWLAGLPDGLGTRMGGTGRGISGGERARLSIARAVASGRPVILLDEPVAHLDHPTAESVVADLLTHAGGRSVIMVTHDGIGLHRVDRVVGMRTEGAGSHAEERVAG